MKEAMKPTILTHIWKNSCTAESNQLFFCWVCNIFASLSLPRLMECYFEWTTQILLNGAHKYFWMDHTNTFEWATQILCLPAQYSISTGKKTTIPAIAEKRILAQNTNIVIDWVAQIILVWQIKNYFCSSCLPNAMQFQRRYKSKITENTNRWIRRKTIAIQIWLRWINPNILVWVWLYWFCKYMKQTDLKISNYMNRKK